MKLLSLFSGIGAFERALNNIGIDYELVNYCEIDKFAAKAYAVLHNSSLDQNLVDITQINTDTLPNDIDLITYGFPCQDISVAGKQKGFFDEDGNKTRSGLFFDALKIIKDTQPRVAIAENVKALTHKNMKLVFDSVLSGLKEIGYNSYWKILDASNYGIPQHRERIFIVSIRSDIDDGNFTFPSGVPLTTCMKDYLETEVTDEFYLSDCVALNAVTAKDCRQPKLIQVAKWARSNYKQKCRIFDSKGLCPTLDICGGGSLQAKVELNGRYRKLTPLEYLRLMGFTDNDYNKLVENNFSKSRIYKFAGNSIVVPVLEHLLRQVRIYW